MSKERNGTFKKVISYIGNYKYFLCLSVLISAVSTALVLYIPILVGNAIDFIVSKGNVDFESIKSIIFKIVIIAITTALLQWLMNVINNKISFNVVRDIRNKAFEKIQKLPLSYIDSHSNGDIVSRVITDADQLSDGLILGFTQLFKGIVTIIGTLCFMLYVDVGITLVVVILTPLSFLIAKFVAKKTFNMFKVQSEIRAEQTSFIDEMISNQKVVEAYGHTNENIDKFDDINERLSKASLTAIFYSSITNPATRFVNSVVYSAVALFGAVMALKDNITVGILSSFLAYATQYTKPFNEISGVITELQNALACANRLIELIELKEVDNNEENGVILKDINGDFSLRNISFSYDDSEFIKDISLDVKSGMKIAIVGHTGCGKTTLINLLMKFYNVNNGKILLDNIDYNDLNVKSLRNNIGMVLQDTWLKNGTIYENISLGKPNATKNEIIDAAKRSYAHTFIKRLPNGYDTYISSDSTSLSGGQRQLLCIARLILASPNILILDEATSNIDTRTEIKIQKAFSNLMEGKTTFIVAHRLSTIKNADLIVVMDKGQIVEQGTHDELLDEKGFYYKLYNSQFKNVNQ